MTQKQAIAKAVFSGKTLTTLEAVAMFGTVKLPSRIAEIEEKYDVYLDREQVGFKTRYGTPGRYLRYKLNRKKYAKQVDNFNKQMKKVN